MTGEPGLAAAKAFRVHRHDVLNGLQMIKAYIQMNRPQDALSSVDRLARWLQSLSLWQSRLVPGDEAVLWAAATCPHVTVVELWPRTRLAPQVAEPLVRTWLWLEEQAILHQIPVLEIRGVPVAQEAGQLTHVRLSVGLPPQAGKVSMASQQPPVFSPYVEVQLQGDARDDLAAADSAGLGAHTRPRAARPLEEELP